MNTMSTETTPETPETPEQTKRREYIQGLRDFADFLEATPGAPTPFATTFCVYLYHRAKFLDAAKAIGSFTKKPDESNYLIEKQFPPFTYQLNISRKEICTKRIEMREIEVWDCPSLLSDEEAQAFKEVTE